MWYLVNWDEGIIEQAKRKKDIIYNCYKCTREKNYYAVYDVSSGEKNFIGWLYNSKKELINNGWAWLFEEKNN